MEQWRASFTSPVPVHGTSRNLDAAISTRIAEPLRLYRLSHDLLIPDSPIAATAMIAGVPFVSKNQRDTKFIVALNLLAYPRTVFRDQALRVIRLTPKTQTDPFPSSTNQNRSSGPWLVVGRSALTGNIGWFIK